MPFPNVPRVTYTNNPLERVICQFRYPAILKIDTELPAQFQAEIQTLYPIYNEKIEYNIGMPFLSKESSTLNNPDDIKKSFGKNHEFTSADGKWVINLTKAFIAISTTHYTKWEDFISSFEKPFQALIKTYNPPFFTRVGLRYTDVFDRSKVNLKDVDWKELIQPYFLGLLGTDLSNKIVNNENNVEVELTDTESLVRIMSSFAMNITSMEKCLMYDCDFYCNKRLESKEAVEKLDFLHTRAYRLIRYIIKDKLHEAMEPKPI